MDARSCAGEPRVLISRDALLHNARLIRQAVGNQTSICAVIKADAYGHGASIVADTLANYPLDEMGNPPVNALAVATLDEAVHLPEHGLPVLILRPIENAFLGRQRQLIEQAIRNGWVLTICSAGAADDVARIAMQMQSMAYIQIMVDTGMSRSGVQPDQFVETLARVMKHVSLRLFGFCTHFACSEDTHSTFTLEQYTLFCELTNAPTAQRRHHGLTIVRHAANSGAIIQWPQTHMDMVRPGLALYGIDPNGQYDPLLPLRPAMKWTASILLTKEIPAGTGVGYGQTWHATRDTRLALVPVGYADGYLRAWSNQAVMIVHDKPAPVAGRVSMDMTMIDVTDIPEAAAGDEVIVMDDDPQSPASIYQLAHLGGTIPYEIISRIGPRVHRVVLDTVKTPEPVEQPADCPSLAD